jgi:hypothetical protein
MRRRKAKQGKRMTGVLGHTRAEQRKRRRIAEERLAYPSRVGSTLSLARDCQGITSKGRRCSRPASIQLGDRAFCEQHAHLFRSESAKD